MASSARSLRVVSLAASAALLAAGLALQPVSAISKGSYLAWLPDNHPTTASIDETITSKVGDPTGEPIKVAVLNGSDKLVRQAGIPIRLVIENGTGNANAILQGDVLVQTNADGIAVFHPSIDKQGFDYRLVAKAADRASLNSGHIANSGPSKKFDIRDGDVTGCSGSCTDSATKNDTHAEVSNADTHGYLVFKLGDSLSGCGAADSEVLSFDVVGTVEARTVVTITVDVGGGPIPDDICFQSASGSPALLPDCVGTPAKNDPPCVEDRTGPGVRPVVITFTVPPGDPKAYVF
jgi:hypothetical protein